MASRAVKSKTQRQPKKRTQRERRSTNRKASSTNNSVMGNVTTGADEVTAVESKPINPRATTHKKTGGKHSEERRWAGEEAAKAFVKDLQVSRTKQEFASIVEKRLNMKPSLAFKENMEKNRDANFPCIDETRVKLEKVNDEKKDYINASHIKIEQYPKNVIIAQMPMANVAGALEDFWRMIFQESVTSVQLICLPVECANHFAELFPKESGEFVYHGSMFINNRKTETGKEINVYTLEVLPDGCSNSLMIQVSQHLFWNAENVPTAMKSLIRSAQMTYSNFGSSSDSADFKVGIVSLLGCGRAGTFLATAASLYQLSKGINPNIRDIMAAIWDQRPFTVENNLQYVSIYTAVMHYIKCKTHNAEVLSKIQTFRAALAAEAEEKSTVGARHSDREVNHIRRASSENELTTSLSMSKPVVAKHESTADSLHKGPGGKDK